MILISHRVDICSTWMKEIDTGDSVSDNFVTVWYTVFNKYWHKTSDEFTSASLKGGLLSLAKNTMFLKIIFFN